MDWPALFAYVIAATGWTWEYIGERLTLPRLYALQKHWATYPPTHIMAAMWCGYKEPEKVSVADVQATTAMAVSEMPVMVLKRPGNV